MGASETARTALYPPPPQLPLPADDDSDDDSVAAGTEEQSDVQAVDPDVRSLLWGAASYAPFIAQRDLASQPMYTPCLNAAPSWR
jgi:hypothetical protein